MYTAGKYIKQFLKISFRIITIFCIIIVLYYAGRIFVCDQFVVPSYSMEPTLVAGDRILVNKLIFGARIYKSLNFSQGNPLKSWRTFAFGKIQPNDVIVFNYPKGYNREKIEFKINYVYVKRCIGTPGDTLSVINGFFKNNNYKSLIGIEYKQMEVSILPNDVNDYDIYLLSSHYKNYGWTVKNTGPVFVPQKGATVDIDSVNYKIYKEIIEYETGKKIIAENRKVILGNENIDSYKFEKNYYFACGDNVLNSHDSRYWGFIPEEFIIGIATYISYSKDPLTGELRKDRLMKIIK
ncbi:MAG: signal peptidase I [Bacteroidales bacterium]|jgi:signal peptidase I|nr:signal peptidase I [Bacteroidales bacterium]